MFYGKMDEHIITKKKKKLRTQKEWTQVKHRGRGKTQRTQKENKFFENKKSLICIKYNNIQSINSLKHN